MTTAETSVGSRVSTLELFFDLVFVFTITQLARLVADAHGAGDFGRAFLILSIAWWMYDGYVFLANNVGTRGLWIRLLMLTGMAAYFVMAMSIPHASDRDGLAFGISYFIVGLVHFGLFTRAPNASARAIFQIAPYNFTSALCVVAGAFVPPEWRWVAWLGAVIMFLLVSFRRGERGFQTSAGHFAERHGLVIIIVIGESVVSLGASPDGVAIGWRLVSVVLLGFALCAAVWWSYFDGDDLLAEHALTSLPNDARTRFAVLAYSYPHMGMIAGLTCMGAGLHGVMSSIGGATSVQTSWLLAAGIGIYLASSSKFRRHMAFARARPRFATAILALGLGPLGWRVSGATELAALIALVVGMLVLERKSSRADKFSRLRQPWPGVWPF